MDRIEGKPSQAVKLVDDPISKLIVEFKGLPADDGGPLPRPEGEGT